MATNARTKWSSAPRLDDDVVRATREDARSATRAATGAKGVKGAARTSVMEAGKRAGSRLAGRAGLAGMALQAGWGAGRAIDEATGVGKKLVDATVGKAIDASVGKGGVKLASDVESRLAAKTKPAQKAEPKPEPKAAKAEPVRPEPKPPVRTATKAAAQPTSTVREGRNANIDDEARKRATASVGMKSGGSVRGNGCAQRGKTKGRFI